MAFLDPTVITIDAILTTKGREAIAKGDGSFNIVKWALADDEVDYSLYNPNHPSGSAFFGEAIIASPVNEAFPDETQVMKYKLVTLPAGTAKLPIINIGYDKITLKQGASLAITPETLNYLNAGSAFEPSGYLVTISDARLLSVFTGIGIDQPANTGVNVISSTNISKSQVGTSFTLVGSTVNTLFGSGVTSLTTQLTVIGRDSGARKEIPLTLTQNL